MILPVFHVPRSQELVDGMNESLVGYVLAENTQQRFVVEVIAEGLHIPFDPPFCSRHFLEMG